MTEPRIPLPAHLTHIQILEIRQSVGASGNVFAAFLGLRADEYRRIEHGMFTPSRMFLRMMEHIKADPAYWKARIQALSRRTS